MTTAGVAAFNGRLFLAKRQAGGALSLRWEFPGGKCETDEGLSECLKREFLEELEVEITVGSRIGSVPFTHRGTEFDLVAMEVSMSGEPTALHVHQDCGWFSEQEMLELDLADSDRLLYNRFKSRFREVLHRSLGR